MNAQTQPNPESERSNVAPLREAPQKAANHINQLASSLGNIEKHVRDAVGKTRKQLDNLEAALVEDVDVARRALNRVVEVSEVVMQVTDSHNEHIEALMSRRARVIEVKGQ